MEQQYNLETLVQLINSTWENYAKYKELTDVDYFYKLKDDNTIKFAHTKAYSYFDTLESSLDIPIGSNEEEIKKLYEEEEERLEKIQRELERTREKRQREARYNRYIELKKEFENEENTLEQEGIKKA